MESAQGQPREVIQIFGNLLPGIIVLKLNFLLSGILVLMARFANFVFFRSQEISLPFVPISKFSNFEVSVREIPNNEVLQV